MVAKRREGVLSVEGGAPVKVLVYGPSDKPPLGSWVALKILESLRAKPKYPRMLAKTLGLDEQIVYYHVKKLEKLGLLERVESRSVRGATATLYRAVYDGYAQLFGELPPSLPRSESHENLRRFFSEFLSPGFLDAVIVVGSPEPHGPYRAMARDGHYAAQLALVLGSLAPPPPDFAVKLDVDVRAERAYDSNMLVIGGPGTNMVAADLNPHLPVRFDEENYWLGLVDGEGRLYSSPADAVIAKIENPFSPGRYVVVAAGVRHIGTKAAVIALSHQHERILSRYKRPPFAVVVRGYDQDGDGKIDSVEPLRYYQS